MSQAGLPACRTDMRSISIAAAGFLSVVAVACGPAQPFDDMATDGLNGSATADAGTVDPGMPPPRPGDCPLPKPTTNCSPVGPLTMEVVCVDHGRGPEWQCPPTPLVLAFDAEPVRFTAGDARFDFTGGGEGVRTDWPTAHTPWLALDRNGNGLVDDATELFGSAVRLADGRRATHGFEALAELDDNRDGVVDAGDRRFGELLIWADHDADRVTSEGELRPARELVSLSLEYRALPSCDRRGNCGIERAAFTWADARGGLHRGEVVDVHLPLR